MNELAKSLETSIEIINAIAEKTGSDENAIKAEWQEPESASDIVSRAWEMASSDTSELFWGAESYER